MQEAAKAVVAAMIEVLQASDPIMGTPSGPLYAVLMGTGMDLETYLHIVAHLKRAGLLVERHNVLYWTGRREAQA